MKMLMIAHFIPYPPHGGAIQRTFNLLREASKYNEIDLICFNQKKIQPNIQKQMSNIEALGKYCRDITVVDIPSDRNRLLRAALLFLNLLSFTPFDVWRFRSKRMASILRDKLSQNKYELIHVDTLALAQYKKYASALPSVLVHHNVESTYILRRGRSEKSPLSKIYLFLQGLKTRSFEKKIAPCFDANITVSDLDSENFRKRIPRATFITITNGTDPDYFMPTSIPQEDILIFTGGLTWYPNKDAMLYFCGEIYPLIKKINSGIRLDIIGRTPPEELTRMAESDSSIKLYGYVDDVRDYVARAAVYIVPIRVGGGTRLKILDAFAAGKAVVSTSIGCEGIDVTPDSDILIGDTPQEFSNHVIRLLNDRNLRGKMGCQARKLIETKYSWEIIGSNLNEAYINVARSGI